jgi:UDP-N-acetylmuramoylalanine--D-glutamate ligase
MKLIELTQGLLILNEHGGDLKREVGVTSVPALWCHAQDERMKKYSVTRTGMVGSHNLDNFSLALAVLEHLGVAQECLDAALAFPGLSHRLEKIGSSLGVTFVNDSKATAMDSVLQAVHSVLSEATCKQVRLLLGGRDKNLPWQELAPLAKRQNVICYFFGECAALAQQKSGLQGKKFAKLETALEKAFSNSVSYDWILLSPGGTSLDEFKNFEERGNFFKNWFLRKSSGNH